MRHRTLLLGAIAALVAAGTVVGGWIAAGNESRENRPPAQRRAGADDAEIRGFRATLTDRETVISKARISWSTRWRLCWTRVPGASAYVVTAVTAEGPGTRPRTVVKPCYVLTVARGVASRPGERPGKQVQLELMRAMLAVSVAARLPNRTLGPRSADIPVGAEGALESSD